MENILEPRPVGQLLAQLETGPAFQFFIPSYQRGYRWDEEQVEDLLNDLFEFIETSKNREEKYCLQPVVVKNVGGSKYEVLDGQQRLTTIYLLLSRLRKNNTDIELFSLSYETRKNSEEFLTKLELVINDDNPDYYFISNAYVTIDNWLKKAKNLKPNIATKLFDAIVESIEFIWYEIVWEIDAIDVFTRINIGKIPLTNSELVKAVFLSKNNLSLGYASAELSDKDFTKFLTLKQNAIALEWDQMEKALQDPKFWGFVYQGNIEYETRIDYLLDLKSNKKPGDKHKYHSFKYFYDQVKKVRNDPKLLLEFSNKNYSVIEDEWADLKADFEILLEWYHNKTYNHLVGFLIKQDENLGTLIKEFKKENRDRFLRRIKDRISNKFKEAEIRTLRYSSDKDRKTLEKLLFLHNVISSLKVIDENTYFPFHKFEDKSWTLEHIFAQNSDELRVEDYDNWLKDHLQLFESDREFKNDALAACIKELVNSEGKKIEKEDFQECFNKVSSYIQDKIQEIDLQQFEEGEKSLENELLEQEYDWVNDDHSIGNLALLDASINSSIKNSLFEIKRRLILQKDRSGLFVPQETKKVFLKYYTKTPAHLAYWTYNDRKAYVESINESLNYLNN